MEKETDTIVARATPSGEGAISVIRISGLESNLIVRKCFHPVKSKDIKLNYMTLGRFSDPSNGSYIDEVFAVFFQKPSSYTGEDACEIHCHGSPAVSAKIIETLCQSGARRAEPGEFTKRAFMNGKIDLTKAEAVCDLIRAQTDRAASLAIRQLRGGLYDKIKNVKESIITVVAELEARLDFPEEITETRDSDAVLGGLSQTVKDIERLILQGGRAKIFRSGARIPVLGKPNTGKSSLFNALLRMERAIVTPHPGTTRDSIEGVVDLKGCPVTYIDTAGIRHTNNQVEKLGIERTRKEISLSDLNLFLLDAASPLSEEDDHIFEIVSQSPFILVLNKNDLPGRLLKEQADFYGEKAIGLFHTSALTGDGIESLETAIADFLISETDLEDALVTNERHLNLLKKSLEFLMSALDSLRQGAPEELAIVDMRDSLHHLSLITGEEIDEEIIDTIFRRFCIGK